MHSKIDSWLITSAVSLIIEFISNGKMELVLKNDLHVKFETKEKVKIRCSNSIISVETWHHDGFNVQISEMFCIISVILKISAISEKLSKNVVQN